MAKVAIVNDAAATPDATTTTTRTMSFGLVVHAVLVVVVLDVASGPETAAVAMAGTAALATTMIKNV